ncbi:MAG: CPBP family intramembrane metalloprotease [Lachnospiraceae bacterium]|nr:CPBP family intramembrane metalloprotease [Lachnospiraceae bacterium]
MNFKFKKPDMVEEAAKTGGKNIFVEILMFLGVFLVAVILQNIFFMLAELPLLSKNTAFQEAISAGDLVTATEIEMEVITSEPMMIVQLFVTAAMILITCLFCKLIQKRKMRTLGYKKPNMWKEYGIGLLVGLGMMTAIVLVGVITGSMSLEFNSEAFTGAGLGTLGLIFVGFLLQGMSEEVLCRGYFLVSLARKKGNVWLGIIVSSLAFGALHLGNAGIAPLAFVNLVLFGIFAGVYFIQRGNIWGIAAIHSIWNFAQGNIFGVLVSGNDFGTTVFTSNINENLTIINGGDFGLEGGILTTIVMVAGIVIMLQTKQRDVAEER